MVELSDKDFIRTDPPQNPAFFWITSLILIACLFILWAGYSWFSLMMVQEVEKNPFFQVTNRQISLFLWQNPEHMRVFAKTKSDYMPGFQYQHKVTLELPASDEYVSAPKEVLFLYHTWDRLISREFAARSIPEKEFIQFLQYTEEWKPRNWPKAPSGYIKLVEGLSPSSGNDLSKLGDESLPFEVRRAFQGWKNFFSEGGAIEAYKPTYKELAAFLSQYPHYARNYWQNITSHSYLQTLSLGKFQETDTVPPEELAPFLKVALFNYSESLKGH